MTVVKQACRPVGRVWSRRGTPWLSVVTITKTRRDGRSSSRNSKRWYWLCPPQLITISAWPPTRASISRIVAPPPPPYQRDRSRPRSSRARQAPAAHQSCAQASGSAGLASWLSLVRGIQSERSASRTSSASKLSVQNRRNSVIHSRADAADARSAGRGGVDGPPGAGPDRPVQAHADVSRRRAGSWQKAGPVRRPTLRPSSAGAGSRAASDRPERAKTKSSVGSVYVTNRFHNLMVS